MERYWYNSFISFDVFFGENSSGKSSIGQFLMMLKQSVESSDRKAVFTGNEDTAVDLGVPSDIVFNQDWNNSISFSYDWALEKEIRLEDVLHGTRYASKHIDFAGEVKIIDEKGQALEVKFFNYTFDTVGKEKIEIALKKKAQLGSNKKSYELIYKNYDFVRSRGRVWDITSPIRFYGFPDEAVACYQNANFLQNINLYHEKLFSGVYYLGPLRRQAKRLYNWNGSIPDSVGYLGQDAVQAILATDDEKRMVNLKYRSPRKPFKAIIAEMLKEMSLFEKHGIQLIIETHSEHLLRRLQRRMAEGLLAYDEFSAYFANNDQFPARLKELQVDIFGNIDNWPKNFFGDIAGDIFAQTDAALQKRIQEELYE